MKRLVMLGLLVLAVTACDATFTMRSICRGDSTPAIGDTSLVRCATLDSLVRRDSVGG